MQDFGTSTGQAKIEKNKLMISEQLTIADNLGANGIVESLCFVPVKNRELLGHWNNKHSIIASCAWSFLSSRINRDSKPDNKESRDELFYKAVL